jgi:hypothetical protein
MVESLLERADVELFGKNRNTKSGRLFRLMIEPQAGGDFLDWHGSFSFIGRPSNAGKAIHLHYPVVEWERLKSTWTFHFSEIFRRLHSGMGYRTHQEFRDASI